MRVKIDVLVVGGGMAGWMAADHARKEGATVAICDKGYIGKCGQSPYATSFYVYDKNCGISVDQVVDEFCRSGEYLTNRYWSRLCIEKSREMKEELEQWGFIFGVSEGPGSQGPSNKADWTTQPGATAAGGGPGNLVETHCPGNSDSECGLKGSAKKYQKAFKDTFGYQARKHLQDIGVQIFDKVMIVNLMQEDGRVCGAVGIGAENEEVYAFESGAVVLCTGGCGMKAPGYPMVSTSTGDGERMAFELGAEVLGKEFSQPMRTIAENTTILGGRTLRPGHPLGGGKAIRGIVNPAFWKQNGEPYKEQKGKVSKYNFAYLDLELELSQGRGPIINDLDGTPYHVVSGAALGMAVRKADGIWPADTSCRTTVPGLFAAGDSLGTMQNGTLYCMTGGSVLGCAVTGAVAGAAAAKEGLKTEVALGKKIIENACDRATAPLHRANGYSPRWVISLIQNLYMPYFVAYIREERRLEAALVNIEYIRKQLIPNLRAEDFHELRLAHEADSIALTTEIRLRSALFRTESRGMHYREDAPCRDDENWLAWTKVVPEGESMRFEKVPIPEEWRIDSMLSYRERYPYVFPREDK